jgi:hypothetical protein
MLVVLREVAAGSVAEGDHLVSHPPSHTVTIRDLVRSGRGLAVGCRRCGGVRAPLLENVAARIGYDTSLGPQITFLCANCGSRDTTVAVTGSATQPATTPADHRASVRDDA